MSAHSQILLCIPSLSFFKSILSVRPWRALALGFGSPSACCFHAENSFEQGEEQRISLEDIWQLPCLLTRSLKKWYYASPSFWPWLKLWWSVLSILERLINNSFQWPPCLVSVPGLNSLLDPWVSCYFWLAIVSSPPPPIPPALPRCSCTSPSSHFLLPSFPMFAAGLFLCFFPHWSLCICPRFTCTPHHPHAKSFMLCPGSDWCGPSNYET